MKTLWIAGFAACLSCIGFADAVFHLDPAAAAEGDGGAARPFKTFAAAQRAVRAAVGDAAGTGAVVVEVASGRHAVGAAVNFARADSGTAARPVVWRAAEKGKACLTGGRAETILRCRDLAHVTFRGLVFADARGSAVTVADSHDLAFCACAFADVGEAAVFDRCRAIRVTGCDAARCDFGAFRFAACGNPATRDAADIVFANGHVTDFARRAPADAPAIAISGCGVTVCRSLIDRGPQAAIRADGCRHRIANNEIHSVCRATGGTGAVWCGGECTIVGNCFHDIGPDGKGMSPNRAVMLADGASGVAILSNRFIRVAEGVSLAAHGNRVERNLFIDNWPAVCVRQTAGDPSARTDVSDNVVVDGPGETLLWVNVSCARDKGRCTVARNVRSKDGREAMPFLPPLAEVGVYDSPDRAVWPVVREVVRNDAHQMTARQKAECRPSPDFTGWAAPGVAPQTAETVAETLNRYVKAGRIAGVVSVLSDADYHETYDCAGWAAGLGTDKPRKMAPDTFGAIFSSTKSFLGAIVMCAIDEGKISLDDPVAKYLPEFDDVKMQDGSKPKRPITVRDLASHVSGFRGGYPLVNRDIPMREVARKLAATRLVSQPGEKFAYNTATIDTVGACVEVATGRPFEAYLKEKILDPLGLRDTTFTPNAEQLTRLATGYVSDETPLRVAADNCARQLAFPKEKPLCAAASGGLFSTPRDMIRFSQMLAHHGTWKGKTIISRKTFDTIFAVKQTPADIPNPYTCGCWIYGDWFGHEGAMRTDHRANLRTGQSRVFFIQTENKAGCAFFQLKRDWHDACDRVQGTPATVFGN